MVRIPKLVILLFIVFLLTTVISVKTIANAVIEINGVLDGYDKEEVFIKTKSGFYSVKRSELPKTQSNHLSALLDKPIRFLVPMNHVKTISRSL